MQNITTPADKALLAAIDLGSNSFRLEIGRIEHGQFYRTEYLKETVRQGGGLDDARNLTADQTLVTDPAAVAAQLGPILGVDPDVLTARLTGDRRFIYISKGLTPEMWSQFLGVQSPLMPGVPTSCPAPLTDRPVGRPVEP